VSETPPIAFNESLIRRPFTLRLIRRSKEMLKYAALFSTLAVAFSLAVPGKPTVPVGPLQVDARHSDAQLITDATTDYGKTKISYTVGIARVAGRVKIDNDDPAQSSFDFTMYPATSTMPPIGEDGKVKSEWFSNYANHTLICFHSKGTSRTSDGHLRTNGTLVLTRVDRNVELNPSEAYSGPVYGPPMIHRVTDQATFVFDSPSPSNTSGQKDALKDEEFLISGSTKVITEDFPPLFKAVMSTYWPPVVQDERCQMPSAAGEDYSGPHCTGTFLVAPGLPIEPRNLGEDYPGTDSGFNTLVGNHLTIAVHLRLRSTASGPQAKTGD
jgi:polyisoprenoid-binding protein YceI